MPYINISTSAKVENKKNFLKEISALISSLTNKSQRFIMAKLDDNSTLYFDDQSPCCFLEIKSIGSLKPLEIANQISNFVNEKLGIPQDKIYIYFEDVPCSMWAWNGKTFG